MLMPIDTGHTNLHLGAPPDWDASHGDCMTLPVHQVTDGDLPCFHSWYKFNQEEIERIVAGSPIRLTIVGRSHPPVALVVTGDLT